MPDENAMSHLSPDTVAAFAERRLNEADRTAAERHMAECADCRREVAHVVRVLRPRSRQWVMGAGSLAAAAAIVMLAVQLIPRSPAGEAPALRDGPADGSAIEIVGPDSTADATGGSVRFTWRHLDPGTRYEFALADESGLRIFSIGLPDTAVTLPDSVHLEPERTYLWFVDAIRPDGRSASSGMRFLRIAR